MKYLLELPVKGTMRPEKYRSNIQWRNGVLITDEPLAIGGADEGPDPYSLLLASLISCTLSTMRLYIEQKGSAMPEIVIDANMFYSIDQDGVAIKIERQISITGLEDEETREKLVRIADNCPISKMLKGSVKITTAFQ